MSTADIPAWFDWLAREVQDETGIVLSRDRAYLVETRLGPVADRLGLALDDLVARLRLLKEPDLRRDIMDAFTTHETSFFRDNHPFEFLADEVLPRIVAARRPERRLRVWSAACSTGQEAYSVAMLLLDRFPEVAGWDLRVLGTDLSADVVRQAQEARYRPHEIERGLSEAYRARFTTPCDGRYVLVPALRDIVAFETMNLISGPYPNDRFDVVLLRNVLIYFNDATRDRVLRRVHSVLAPDGVLLLGGPEGASRVPEVLEVVRSGRTTWHRPRGGAP
jgi:chemotaxis protein methyltransferase CheR